MKRVEARNRLTHIRNLLQQAALRRHQEFTFGNKPGHTAEQVGKFIADVQLDLEALVVMEIALETLGDEA